MPKNVENPSRLAIDRLLVVGPIGAGKSYAAARLATALAKPLINLDRLMLDEEHRPKPKRQFVEEAEEFFGRPEYSQGWVTDGTFRSLRHLTWDRADMIGYIRPPVVLNIGLVAFRALTGDISGGNSPQPMRAQLDRLFATRSEDLRKIDHTTAEYAEQGTPIVQSMTAGGLVRSVMSIHSRLDTEAN
jgi:adenylate kinase family enzyme